MRGHRHRALPGHTHKAAAEFGGKLYSKCNKWGLITPTFPEMTEREAEGFMKEMDKPSKNTK